MAGEKADRAHGSEYRDLMEEKRLVRTDKSLRCILYTHHKYYPLTALCLAGDNTRAHSQIKIFMFVNLIHERQFRKCCIKYDYPAQAALPGLASVSLTAPGLSTRDGGDCLFGFGCSQQSPVLNISFTLHHMAHQHTPLTSPTITADRCQHGAGPALRSARIFIHETGKRKELYPAVFLLA